MLVDRREKGRGRLEKISLSAVNYTFERRLEQCTTAKYVGCALLLPNSKKSKENNTLHRRRHVTAQDSVLFVVYKPQTNKPLPTSIEPVTPPNASDNQRYSIGRPVVAHVDSCGSASVCISSWSHHNRYGRSFCECANSVRACVNSRCSYPGGKLSSSLTGISLPISITCAAPPQRPE